MTCKPILINIKQEGLQMPNRYKTNSLGLLNDFLKGEELPYTKLLKLKIKAYQPLNHIISELGGPAKVAKRLKIGRNNIYQWTNHYKGKHIRFIPLQHATKLLGWSQLGYKLIDIRPDLERFIVHTDEE